MLECDGSFNFTEGDEIQYVVHRSVLIKGPTLYQQEVTEIIRAVNSGQTEPYQCRLEDGELYAVKGRNATPRGLIAEAVSAILGQRFGLPIPDFCACQIPRDLLESTTDPNVNRSLGAGICFASHWVQPADVFNLSMVKKVGDSILAEIYVFDHWIENGDRSLTPKGGNVNLLFSLADEALIAFDHNLAFSESHCHSHLEVHVGRASWRRAKNLTGFQASVKARMLELLAIAASLSDNLPREWIDDAPDMPDRILKALSRIETQEFWDELG